MDYRLARRPAMMQPSLWITSETIPLVLAAVPRFHDVTGSSCALATNGPSFRLRSVQISSAPLTNFSFTSHHDLSPKHHGIAR
jgi:hypothetical protein